MMVVVTGGSLSLSLSLSVSFWALSCTNSEKQLIKQYKKKIKYKNKKNKSLT